jgi:hypothetical protein
MTASYPRIPYGEADIRRIRLRGWLYVDKTRFLRKLEGESYAFLIRPRRFGKSLWVSVLQNYYDRSMAEHWHGVFDGTDIGREPTADRSRYVVLRFNFSAFDDTLETLRERFETYCDIELRAAMRVNPATVSPIKPKSMCTTPTWCSTTSSSPCRTNRRRATPSTSTCASTTASCATC